jgi:glucokinase
MLLAGDLGGTKTLLGLYERHASRPQPIVTREFATLDYGGLADIIAEFLATDVVKGQRIEVAVIGVAGPVHDQEVTLTNIPWKLNAKDLAKQTSISSIVLLNDVEAMAYSVEALASDERVMLQANGADPSGNGAILSIGTGVGMAILHRIGERFTPLASEGGHADFAARTEREIALVRALRPRHGRVEIERVVSGPGLGNIGRFTHGGACSRFPPNLATQDEPAHVTRAALDGSCMSCREALDMFVEAMGAVAGNLALTARATGGVFLGGGVPAKVLSALQSGKFVAAFNAKAPFEAVLQSTPVTVITMSGAGLLGAAVYANGI